MGRIRLQRITYLGIVFSFMLNSVVGCSPKFSHAETSPKIDSKAAEVIKESCDYLKNSKQFVVETETTFDEVKASGQKLQFGETGTAYLRRPNKLRAEIKGAKRDLLFWYDGKTVNLLEHHNRTFTSSPAPKKIDDALDFVVERFQTSPPLVDLFVEDPYRNFTKNVQTGEYINLEDVRGKSCHHLAFTQETVDWQIWIEDGEQIVPRKLVITYKNEAGQPQYTANFTRWNMNPNLPDVLFNPPISKKAEEIPFPSDEKKTKKNSAGPKP